VDVPTFELEKLAGGASQGEHGLVTHVRVRRQIARRAAGAVTDIGCRDGIAVVRSGGSASSQEAPESSVSHSPLLLQAVF
jgi:hypothetical protein